MEKDVILYWKRCLQSNNKIIQLDTLMDIVNSLNQVRNLKENEMFYVRFINADLSYLLSEMLIYQHRIITNLLIKIICHLSEVKEFFKNDFYRYIKSGLRLINSFCKDASTSIRNDSEGANYHQSILNFCTLLLKRAKSFNVNFKDERVPKTSLAITASGLTNLDSRAPEKLEFVNAVFDIIELMEVDASTRSHQEKKLMEIIKNLDFDQHDVAVDDYNIQIANFIHHTINFAAKHQSKESADMLELVAVKFLYFVKIILDDVLNASDVKCEIFLNLFYYFLKSSAVDSISHAIINRFLTFNGLHFLIYFANQNDASAQVIAFKSRVVIAEIMLHILKHFHSPSGYDLDVLREKYMKMIFKCDFNPQNMDFENISELSRETLMFIVFKYFVTAKWNEKMSKSKGELLGSVAFIIEVFKTRKIAMDKGLATMAFYIYTANYVNIKIKENSLMEDSSTTLMKYVGKINIIINLNFLKWWLLHNWNKRAMYEKLINFMITPMCSEQFSNIDVDDLFVFDLKYLLDMFFDDTTPTGNLEKLTKIICYMPINLRDYGKLLNFYKKQRNAENRRRAIYILQILVCNCQRLNIRLQIMTCDAMRDTLTSCRGLQERLLALKILVGLVKP